MKVTYLGGGNARLCDSDKVYPVVGYLHNWKKGSIYQEGEDFIFEPKHTYWNDVRAKNVTIPDIIYPITAPDVSNIKWRGKVKEAIEKFAYNNTVTLNTLVDLRKKTEEKAEEIKNKYKEIDDKERSAELRSLITRVFQYAWAERSKLQGVANNSIESARVERLKEAIEKFTK